ncbi:MAG: type II toxin-antitoxin system ParD family antitoxin [Alphaproteobacteria bacterium]|nr:type II toxin-antitoxin system ParD family antitoxin [Alphaproteobacteria bacterium]
MAKISISMSDTMETYVSSRVASGDYNNTSEYFRDLVRRDQEKRAADDKLRALIEEGRASGVSNRTFGQIWADAEERAKHKRHAG